MNMPSAKVGEGHAEIELKGKDGSGAMLLCKKEAKRKDKGWNSQSLVPAGSNRQRASSQQDLSVHRGSGEVQERENFSRGILKGVQQRGIRESVTLLTC